MDVSQVDAATSKVLEDVNKINLSLSNIKSVSIKIDTGEVKPKADAATSSLTDLIGKLTGLPVGKVSLDIGNAEQAAGALNSTLTGLLSTVGVNTSALAGLTAALGPAGLVAAAGVATVALAQLGAEMKALNRQLENLTLATGPALDAMKADFQALFTSLPADGGDLVKAQTILFKRFEETGPAAQAAIADLHAMSRVLGTDLPGTTDAATRVMAAWNVATADQGQALRDLTLLAKASTQPFSELSAEMARSAVDAKALGLDMRETGVFLVQVAEAGLQPRAVFSALREAMHTLAASGIESKGAFREFVAEIQQAGTDAEAAAIGVTAFGKQAGPELAALIRTGRIDLDKLIDRMEAAGDPLASNFARGTTAAGQFTTALHKLEKDLEPAGTAILNFAAALGTDLVTAITTVERAITDFMSSGAVQAFLALRAKTEGVGGLAATAAASLTPAGPLLAAGAGAAAIGGGAAATAAQSVETTKLNAALDEQEKRTRAAADGQQNLAGRIAETTGKVASLQEQLTAAGGNTALIEQLDAAATQTKTLDTAISTLTDRSLAAALQATKNLAEQQFLLTGSWEDWDAAIVTAQGHLDAQRASQEAANAAAKEGAAAQKAIEDAMAKAATVAGDTYAARLNDLANSVLPNLDAASATTLKQAILLGDQQTALGVIAQATGQSQEQLAAAISGTGAAAQQAAQQAAALSKGFTGFLTEEQTSRWQGAIGQLSSGVDAATAAQAKFLAATGETGAALDLLLSKVGANTALKDSLLAGGAAAQDAKDKIAALTTFVRANGEMKLKIDVDIANVNKSIEELKVQSARAAEDAATQRADTIRSFVQGQQQINESASEIRENLASQLQDISDARSASASQLASDLAAVTEAQNKGLADVASRERAAARAHTEAVQSAQTGLALAFATAKQTYDDGIKGLQDQATQAIQTAANAAASGLQALSGAMTTFNQQQTQNAFAASVATQNAQLAAIAAQPGFDPNLQVNKANAANVAALQASGQAAIAQANQADALAKAKNSVAQQQLDATKKLSDTMTDLAKATQKLVDQRQASDTAAKVTAQNQTLLADRALGISRMGEDAFTASNELTKSVQQFGTQSLEVLGQRAVTVSDEEGIKLGGTAATRAGVSASAKAQMDAAQQRFDQRTAQLDRHEAEARTRAQKALDKLEEQRKLQVEAFQRQLQREAIADQRRLEDEKRQMESLQTQKQMLQELKRTSGPSVQFGQTTIQETGKDMLTKVADYAKFKLRV